MKYYMIACECGHVGIKRCTIKNFVIKARGLIEACDIAKRMPSVKHTKPVLSAREITSKEYYDYLASGGAYHR